MTLTETPTPQSSTELLLSAADEAAALEQLHDLGCTDGLPVVIPTAPRVERMALASGYDPDVSVGVMGPLGGAATIEKIAACAVMAGCLPDHMPLVLAAVRAVLAPEFDSTEMQGTTHCLAPIVIVNGPARHDCGPVESGFGCLGPGFRANAAIGRALRLAMMNIGGARPGVSDMALHGHPGKFTYCLGESEESSPFEPLHVARGYEPGQSVVTVAGVEAPQSVIGVVDADEPDSAVRLLRSIGKSLARVGANNAHFECGTGVVVLNPDHAAGLAAAGYTRATALDAIWRFAVNPVADLREVSGVSSRAFAGRDDAELVSAFLSPEDILMMTAGGGGLYSMVMTSWGAGPHRNPAVSVEVETGQACAVPLAPGVIQPG